MNEPFGPRYAELYDLVYREKEYGRECDVLEALFARHALGPVVSIVDLGCGTGAHALELARRGYRVVGVDRAEAMLAVARVKAVATGLERSVRFESGDLRSYRSAAPADAALMMFAVLGYLTTDDDLACALEGVAAGLRRGGLFVFDVWYGPAVARLGPGRTERDLVAPDGRALRRVASGRLDRAARLCSVTIAIERADDPGAPRESEELHTMRCFERDELERLLARAGLDLLALTAFPSLDEAPSAASWNVLGVARQRQEPSA